MFCGLVHFRTVSFGRESVLVPRLKILWYVPFSWRGRPLFLLYFSFSPVPPGTTGLRTSEVTWEVKGFSLLLLDLSWLFRSCTSLTNTRTHTSHPPVNHLGVFRKYFKIVTGCRRQDTVGLFKSLESVVGTRIEKTPGYFIIGNPDRLCLRRVYWSS